MTTEKIMGKDLTQKDLDIINEYRKIRLNRSNLWDHNVNNHFHDRLFFLVKDNNNLVSFGTIRPIKVYINEKEIEIYGIQAIASVVQGKGYGKILMQAMIQHANNEDLILVGFCDPKNAEFYIKSGLEVFKDKNTNFIYILDNGEEYTESGDVIYYSASNQEIKNALISNQKIVHYIKHW